MNALDELREAGLVPARMYLEWVTDDSGAGMELLGVKELPSTDGRQMRGSITGMGDVLIQRRDHEFEAVAEEIAAAVLRRVRG